MPFFNFGKLFGSSDKTRPPTKAELEKMDDQYAPPSKEELAAHKATITEPKQSFNPDVPAHSNVPEGSVPFAAELDSTEQFLYDVLSAKNQRQPETQEVAVDTTEATKNISTAVTAQLVDILGVSEWTDKSEKAVNDSINTAREVQNDLVDTEARLNQSRARANDLSGQYDTLSQTLLGDAEKMLSASTKVIEAKTKEDIARANAAHDNKEQLRLQLGKQERLILEAGNSQAENVRDLLKADEYLNSYNPIKMIWGGIKRDWNLNQLAYNDRTMASLHRNSAEILARFQARDIAGTAELDTAVRKSILANEAYELAKVDAAFGKEKLEIWKQQYGFVDKELEFISKEMDILGKKQQLSNDTARLVVSQAYTLMQVRTLEENLLKAKFTRETATEMAQKVGDMYGWEENEVNQTIAWLLGDIQTSSLQAETVNALAHSNALGRYANQMTSVADVKTLAAQAHPVAAPLLEYASNLGKSQHFTINGETYRWEQLDEKEKNDFIDTEVAKLIQELPTMSHERLQNLGIIPPSNTDLSALATEFGNEDMDPEVREFYDSLSGMDLSDPQAVADYIEKATGFLEESNYDSKKFVEEAIKIHKSIAEVYTSRFELVRDEDNLRFDNIPMKQDALLGGKTVNYQLDLVDAEAFHAALMQKLQEAKMVKKRSSSAKMWNSATGFPSRSVAGFGTAEQLTQR